DVSFVKPGYEVEKLPVSQTGDEVMLLADALPEAVFSVHSSKSTAAQNIAQSGMPLDLILVDDGFQHWQLHRNLDVVTYDAAVPPGQLKMFPNGVLREPKSSLKRADIIVITRSKFAKDLTRLTERLQKLSPQADIYSARFSMGELVGKSGNMPLKYLEDKSVFLFAGIGNFRSFEKNVRLLTHNLDYKLELSDHQKYTDEVFNRIKVLANKYESQILLTTGKDWFKIRHFDFGRELYYLSQTVDIDPGEEKLVSRLLEKIGVKREVG
ncbi:MAG TPA: tetraacyldisaccharide 4'-kinase, partial [candidate division Zixibacteria bacterium]|nr:tetraacyldisaccharide 4'-kinase [candidate division Zixibacteria bacterium]